jgi:hypothetical protein
MPFIFKATKVNISISYDGLTAYETNYSRPNIQIMTRVLLAGTEVLVPLITLAEDPLKCLAQAFQDASYDRNIYVEDADHALYHQDQFDRETGHYHLKFYSQIDLRIINKLAILFSAANLFDAVEKDLFLQLWEHRNDAAIATLKSQLTHDKSEDIYLIIKHIKTITDVDTLIALQKHLQTSPFDYLRHLTGIVKISFWRGTDSQQHVVPTSKSWAMIEKAFSLQIANSIQRVTNFAKDVVNERARQLHKYHKFFALKRLAVPGQRAEKMNASCIAFSASDKNKFEEKYTSHFSKYR